MTCFWSEGKKKMPCYFPKIAWMREGKLWHPKSEQVGSISFKRLHSDAGAPIQLACGQCFGCRRKKAVQYGARAVHETMMMPCSSFITLTYAKAPVSLVHEDYQKFMKRFREANSELRIRQLMCGEYGDRYGRPHFHALIWGTDFFHDRRKFKQMNGGYWLYNSDLLDSYWQHGHATISNVTFESAAYVGGYCFKKINGDLAPDRKWYPPDPVTGELRRKEYIIPSREPAIGIPWLEKYYKQVFERDERLIFNDGRSVPIPARYKKWCAEHHPALYEDWKMRMRKRIEDGKFDIISDLEGSDPEKYAEEYNAIVNSIDTDYAKSVRLAASEVAKAKFSRNANL